jgi:hypothetical protein
MAPGWMTNQALGWIPQEEGEESSIRLHHEVLAPAKAFNIVRVPTALCRQCQIAIVDYAPEGLIYRA